MHTLIIAINYCHNHGIFHAKWKPDFLMTDLGLSDQKQKFVYKGERNISQVGYDSCSTHLLPSNTILMSSRAPIGLLAIAKTELCTNQGFKSFVPKSGNTAIYLY